MSTRSPRSPSAGRQLPVLLLAVAYVAQAGVLAGIFLMGLGWGGISWAAGLAQAVGGFVLIAWLAGRRSYWALAVRWRRWW